VTTADFPTGERLARAVAASLLTLTCALAQGCGIRTDPRPPEDTMARAPTDVRTVRVGDVVRVEWRSPGDSVDGKRLGDLAAFVVERRVPGARFTPVGEVQADTAHRLRPIRNYSWVDENPVGDDAQYRVVAYTADGQRGVPANPVGITVPTQAVPGSPEPPSKPQP
jgi:hypothetical protein